MPVKRGKHDVRDIAVRMARDGSGDPLLFLHGAGDWPEWGPFLDQLATRFDVMVPEHPGFGASDNPPWIRNVADVAMYYLDFLDALNAPPVHIVGHSLGGWIAAELAIRNCAQVRSLTLIALAGVRVKGVPSGDTFIWSPDELAPQWRRRGSCAEQGRTGRP